MTATKPIDTCITGTAKRVQDIKCNESDNEADSSDDISSILSMPLPSIAECNLLIPSQVNDDFLRLTTMVRSVYFSHLHKCLLNNYMACCNKSNKAHFCGNVKKCAEEMELNAVRASLEATVYRKYMLKLISDIKSHTTQVKVHKNLLMCMEIPPSKNDVAVQTWDNDPYPPVEKSDITSNFNESCTLESVLLDNVELTNGKGDVKDYQSICNEISNSCFSDSTTVINCNGPKDCRNQELSGNVNIIESLKLEKTLSDEDLKQNEETSHWDGINDQRYSQIEDENTQDSLLQHMEDMFCESDDSSDLMTLIEKHSGVTKANMDKEISNMCLDTTVSSVLCFDADSSTKVKGKTTVKPEPTPQTLTLNDYREMKNKVTGSTVPHPNSTINDKNKRRDEGVWFVERVHRVSKLKAKMTELSLQNYRKHGRVKQMFIELFGESDDEEMMPDSPICIEEHLTACKERIAPWIVKYLMPVYKKKRIKNRYLFKLVAKHITDMLILENTFPEQSCVYKYIHNYFKNKKFIKTVQEIYL